MLFHASPEFIKPMMARMNPHHRERKQRTNKPPDRLLQKGIPGLLTNEKVEREIAAIELFGIPALRGGPHVGDRLFEVGEVRPRLGHQPRREALEPPTNSVDMGQIGGVQGSDGRASPWFLLNESFIHQDI
jgi:hypothetical protein